MREPEGIVESLEMLQSNYPNSACVADTDSIEVTAKKMKALDRTTLAVLEGMNLKGVISARDIVFRVLAGGHDAWFCNVGDFARKSVVICTDRDSPALVERLMDQEGLSSLPMVNASGKFLRMVDRVPRTSQGSPSTRTTINRHEKEFGS